MFKSSISLFIVSLVKYLFFETNPGSETWFIFTEQQQQNNNCYLFLFLLFNSKAIGSIKQKQYQCL